MTSSLTKSSALHRTQATSAVKDSVMSSSVVGYIPTSESREKTTTSKPNTEDYETVVAVEIRIERTWNDELRDKASPTYRDLASLIENEARKCCGRI